MGNENKGSLGASCSAICWLVAILLGLLVVAILVNWANWPMIIVLVLGLITVVGAGWVLPNYFCKGNDVEAAPLAKAAVTDTSVADAKADADAKAAADKTAAAKVAADTQAAKGEDYDADGVVEGENEGVKPSTLTAARDGKADDLKQIKGIGPKMEIMCNEMGFYHFDQVAAWSEAEVAWVNANLKGFKGRVTRDEWVDQAKLLAAGGETEFSKRVGKGGVY